ncbi:oligopeptide/dipeptide ABC transporter ATP-binding protein [Desulfosalsimonas propionicica]|uniref:Oligopeptide/dipeptide ABC transporter ATP-binding protein n=1 Tax=Desulfosalsimonas propionicica TaxID=332175 RepID=A0A7W0C8W0_9BACT|nr:ABC transporter ATP-binding protein [Desulfosalsimonas propionicica]MBA2881245.1 oligopeptide/dipeptide ABC transporter ATP-binding protein [Desulfosalsimonas propionicica]
MRKKTAPNPADAWDPAREFLLEVLDLRTWFETKKGLLSGKSQRIRAVDGVSFCLEQNQTLGLVGESGCGKTTLGRTLLGLEAASAGDVRFRGRPLLHLSRKQMDQMRRHLQVVFQDPVSSLNPRMNVMDIITEGLERFGMLEGTKQEHARRLLAEVGLDKAMIYRFPHEFSGGQRQRINIARAVSLRPDLVICDEAVSALDVSIQAQVINLLLNLQETHHLSYLFISHDLGVVSNIADQVAVMYLGRIVEIGATAQIIGEPCHPYTQMLIAALPVAGQKRAESAQVKGETPSPADPPPGCHFHPRCPKAIAVCRDTAPDQIRLRDRTVCCHLYA